MENKKEMSAQDKAKIESLVTMSIANRCYENLENNSDFAVTKAVKGMLPKNNLGRQMLKKLKVFKGEQHNHEAQKPEVIKLVGGRN